MFSVRENGREALLRMRGPKLDKKVLSVSVVLSVGSAVECQMRFNDVLCAVCLSGTTWSAVLVLLERNAFDGNANL